MLLLAWSLYLYASFWSLFVLTVSVHKTSSFYFSPPAPKSLLHNPSHFLRDRFPLATLISIIFLFFYFWLDGCMELMRSNMFIHFYVAANESTSGWEFYCLFLNPHNSFILVSIPVVSVMMIFKGEHMRNLPSLYFPISQLYLICLIDKYWDRKCIWLKSASLQYINLFKRIITNIYFNIYVISIFSQFLSVK